MGSESLICPKKLDFKENLAISGNVRTARRQIPRQRFKSKNFSGLAG
jgi:hypothetical protein